jgi:hypothetical protein
MPQGLAVVTGASAGIGREMARRLAARGYDLVLVARREERLRALGAEIAAESRRTAEVLALDLGDPGARRKLIEAMEQRRERLTLVINNAGFGIAGPTLRPPLARILELIELNIRALTELSWVAAKLFVERRGGGLINVASTAAFQAVPYMNVYSASKAYVLSFTEALAEEVAEHGVRVMALCPGSTETEFHSVAGMKPAGPRGLPPMSAAECVRIGLDDFERGKRLSVTGAANKVMVFGTRLAPRRFVHRSAARLMRDRADDSA